MIDAFTRRLRASMRRLAGLFATARHDRELADELESHIHLLADEYVRGGLSADEARRAARLRFGSIEATKELYRERRGLPFVETLLHDIRHAGRVLARNRGFAITAIVILALGIGVNTGIFTIFNRSLSPLSVPDPETLVRLTRVTSGGESETFSLPDYIDLRDRTRTLSDAIAFTSETIDDGPADSETTSPPFRALFVSGNYLTALGGRAALGRTLLPLDDDRAAAAESGGQAAVLSEVCWQRRFDRDPAIVGRTLTLNGQRLTIVGVMPRSFTGLRLAPIDVWIPLALHGRVMQDPGLARRRDTAWIEVAGRLASDATPTRAAAELTAIARATASASGTASASATPDASPTTGARATTDDTRAGRPFAADVDAGPRASARANDLRDLRIDVSPASRSVDLRGGEALFALLVMTATSLVLAVACANIAGVLLARAVSRQQELSVRLSLGATRRRLVRQLLTESLLLSALGGAGGLLIAYWIAPIVLRLALPSANRDAVPDLSPDVTVFAFSLLLSAIAALLFGLLPAWHAARVDLTSTLKGGLTLFGHSIRRTRLLNGLVALQMALALVLLVSAALLVRSMLRVYAIDPGFETTRLLSMELEIALDDRARAAAPTLIAQAADGVRRLPGVRAVTIARYEPLGASGATYRWRDDRSRVLFEIAMNDVSADFFDVLRIPLVRGRTFSRDETDSGAPVVIITDALARRLWPDRDPIGQVIDRFDRATVIGVTRDAHTAKLTSPAPMIAYRPLRLATLGAAANSPDSHTFVALVAATHGSPRMSLAAAERVVRRVDPRIEVDAQTGEQGLDRWMRPARLASILSASLGTLALLLTLVGIYGVVAFAVGQRTHEIAMRMALGAARRDIVSLVLRQALTPIAIGLTAGWLGLLVVTPLLRAQLHDLSPFDPATFASVSLAVIAATTCAIYLPARLAARLDPMRNLRRE